MQGSNGRSINILYEGSQEPSDEGAMPARDPGHVAHLNNDQRELLASQLSDYANDRRSIGIQTDQVIIFRDEDEVINSFVKDSSVQQKDANVGDRVSALETKIDQLATLIKEDISRKLEEIIPSRLSDLFSLNTFSTPNLNITDLTQKQTSSTTPGPARTKLSFEPKEDQVEAKSDKQPSPIKEVASTADSQASDRCEDNEPLVHISIDPEVLESNLNDDDHMMVDLQLVERLRNEEASVEPVPSCESNDTQTNGQNSADCIPLSTISSNTVSNYIEISSPADMNLVKKGSKIRISRDLARSTKMCASNVGNFGWQLAQKVYSIEERIGRNYAGRGKPAWSPRRKLAIEDTVRENYGNNPEFIRQVRKACDNGMRSKGYTRTYKASHSVGTLNALLQNMNIPILPQNQIVQP